MDTARDLDIIDLYNSINRDPDYLEGPKDQLFFSTPLHRAASEGHTRLALEMLRLKPSLGKKLDLDGLSPLDLALRNDHTATVKGLIRYDPELIRVQGRGGITPLHYVVEMEIIDLLTRFLLECPSSVNDLTVGQETAVHIAVRKQKLTAFKVLLGWIKRTDNTTMLRWRDDKGNTVLHLAALTNQQQVVRLLVDMVDVNAENSEGKTALDILPQDIRWRYHSSMHLLALTFRSFFNLTFQPLLKGVPSENLSSMIDIGCEGFRRLGVPAPAFSCPSFLKGTPSEYLSSERDICDQSIEFGAYLQFGISGEIRSAFLVIFALVATATYHAALAPPSVFSNGQNTFVNAIFPNTTSVNATTYILPNSTNIDNKTQITNFTIVNTICFGLAMGMCFIFTLTPRVIMFLYGPLCLFLVAYAFLTHGILNTGSIISAMLVAFCVPICLVIPWWIIIIRKDCLTKRSDDYSLSEAIYLIVSSKYA